MIMPDGTARTRSKLYLVECAVDLRSASGDAQLLQSEHSARGRGVEKRDTLVVAPTLRGRGQTPYHSHHFNTAEEGFTISVFCALAHIPLTSPIHRSTSGHRSYVAKKANARPHPTG
jgi:hypothetical protein